MADIAATGKKVKAKGKGKTVSLNDFLAEGGASVSIPPPVNWADVTEDLESDTSPVWHAYDDGRRGPPIDRSSLPTAPRAARAIGIDASRLPARPPYTAFLGNLPYDVTEDCIYRFFHGLKVNSVRLPRDAINPERLKGFGYAEFEDVESLMGALALNEETMNNRQIRVDIADHVQDRDREERSSAFSRDRDRDRDRDRERYRDSDLADSDWRARRDSPPRSEEGRENRRFGDEYDGGRDRVGSFAPRRGLSDGGDWGRDRDRGVGDGLGDRDRGSRGFGFRREDGGERNLGEGQWRDNGGDRGSVWRESEKREERVSAPPTTRQRLVLQPRSTEGEPKKVEGSRSSSIFGNARPVDTAAREREIEERLKKREEEMLRKVPNKQSSWHSEPEKSWRDESRQASSQTFQKDGGEADGKKRDANEKRLASRLQDSTISKQGIPAPPPKQIAWAKGSDCIRAAAENHSGKNQMTLQGHWKQHEQERAIEETAKRESSQEQYQHRASDAMKGDKQSRQAERFQETLQKKEASDDKEAHSPNFCTTSQFAALMVDDGELEED
uniref:Eukaryotic translation initiation factor 4B n=1 Tax=Eptatretus burgeri TaxID=7764 RepID=A0A8C4Q9Q3_EPTBU